MSLLRSLVPPSLRFHLRRLATRVKVRSALFAPWRWRARKFSFPAYDVIVFAPPGSPHAHDLLGLEGVGRPATIADADSPNAVLVTPAVLPGALHVPCDVHTIVPLQQRTIEDVMTRYDRELRRSLKKQRPRYTFRQATDPREVEQLNREMLVPYAQQRHGADAVCPPLDEVRVMALETGRLDVIEENGAPVACHLGYGLTRTRQRHWITLRFGYPQSVFDDRKRLREVNSMNTYLALEWAQANGFDAYDLGSASSRPDDGLLQWKRRRDGAIDCYHTVEWLSVKLPRAVTSEFLWDHPLFTCPGNDRVELALGLPTGTADDAALTRFKELGFSGLSKVRLHTPAAPSEAVVVGLRALYEVQTRRPEEIVIHTPKPPRAALVLAPAEQLAG